MESAPKGRGVVLSLGQIGHLKRGYPILAFDDDQEMVLVRTPDARSNQVRTEAAAVGMPEVVVHPEQLAGLEHPSPEIGGVRVTTSSPPTVWHLRSARQVRVPR